MEFNYSNIFSIWCINYPPVSLGDDCTEDTYAREEQERTKNLWIRLQSWFAIAASDLALQRGAANFKAAKALLIEEVYTIWTPYLPALL